MGPQPFTERQQSCSASGEVESYVIHTHRGSRTPGSPSCGGSPGGCRAEARRSGCADRRRAAAPRGGGGAPGSRMARGGGVAAGVLAGPRAGRPAAAAADPGDCGATPASPSSAAPSTIVAAGSPGSPGLEARSAAAPAQPAEAPQEQLRRENEELRLQVRALRDEQAFTAELHSQVIASVVRERNELVEKLQGAQDAHGRAVGGDEEEGGDRSTGGAVEALAVHSPDSFATEAPVPQVDEAEEALPTTARAEEEEAAEGGAALSPEVEDLVAAARRVLEEVPRRATLAPSETFASRAQCWELQGALRRALQERQAATRQMKAVMPGANEYPVLSPPPPTPCCSGSRRPLRATLPPARGPAPAPRRPAAPAAASSSAAGRCPIAFAGGWCAPAGGSPTRKTLGGSVELAAALAVAARPPRAPVRSSTAGAVGGVAARWPPPPLPAQPPAPGLQSPPVVPPGVAAAAPGPPRRTFSATALHAGTPPGTSSVPAASRAMTARLLRCNATTAPAAGTAPSLRAASPCVPGGRGPSRSASTTPGGAPPTRPAPPPGGTAAAPGGGAAAAVIVPSPGPPRHAAPAAAVDTASASAPPAPPLPGTRLVVPAGPLAAGCPPPAALQVLLPSGSPAPPPPGAQILAPSASAPCLMQDTVAAAVPRPSGNAGISRQGSLKVLTKLCQCIEQPPSPATVLVPPLQQPAAAAVQHTEPPCPQCARAEGLA